MELSLKKFGIFRDQKFPLGQVTVFLGQNETGKTTLFDSIVSSLLKISGATAYGKKLNARYEKDREAKIEPNPAGISSLPAFSFLNSHAVREGNIGIVMDEAKGKKEMLDAVQKSLFDSGFDAKYLRQKCLENAERTGARKSARDLKAANTWKEQKNAEFQTVDSERKRIIQTWSSLPQLEEKRKKYVQKMEPIDSKVEEINSRLAILDQSEKYSYLDQVYSLALEREEKEKAASLSAKLLEKNSEKQITSLSDQIKEIQLKWKNQSETLVSLQSQVGTSNQNKQELDEKEKKIAGWETKIKSLEKKLDDLFENLPQLYYEVWQKQILAIAGILFVSGLSLSWFLQSETHSRYLGFLGIVLIGAGSFLIFWKGKEKRFEKDETKIKSEMVSLSEELILLSEGEIRPLLVSRDGLREAFKTYYQKLTEVRSKSSSLLSDLEKKKAEISDLSQNQTHLQSEKIERENSLRSLLSESGSSSLEELREKLSSAKAVLQEFESIESRLKKVMEDNGWSSFDELRRRVKDELESYQKLGISKTFTPAHKTEKQNLKSDLGYLLQEKESLSKERGELEKEIHTVSVRSTEQLNQVLKQWEKGMFDFSQAESSLKELEKNIEAYQILGDVFAEMDAGSEDEMSSLVQSLSSKWNGILTGSEIRKIDWNSLSEDVPKAADKAGQVREFDHLSTGTKELLFFAMRLEYALRVGRESHLPWLLLDEPFRHMDVSRTESAVRYTLDFLKKENWNGVFFTFDESLSKCITENAGSKDMKCILHKLG
ncbi:ATP-binding protein [Leptospira idonii]|uniref:YhaN AAA domain-containing protein n=1 Tax=Leptospira idonii TaxID=1193500 RepID=A0A4R9M2C1_9LEPT|nr:AAA family ATPase [Leptospira idonii]TGN18918.1 hypothetical protein EHS15_10895 [Leptospira idonii]